MAVAPYELYCLLFTFNNVPIPGAYMLAVTRTADLVVYYLFRNYYITMLFLCFYPTLWSDHKRFHY